MKIMTNDPVTVVRSRLGVLLALLGQAACATQGVAQDPLDLPVGGAHLVCGPALHRGPDLGVYTQGILLAGGHVLLAY